jgi:hypothetical protein
MVEVVNSAIDSRDLDGHLAALVLHTGYRSLLECNEMSLWVQAVEQLLCRNSVSSKSPVDVAILGVQLALGGAAKHQDEYADAARRELAREPLPPAACVRDDERLLLGVAAGIGAAAPQLADELVVILRAREHTTNVRQRCLDLWAESLARGAPKLTADIARLAMRHLGAGETFRPVADEDRIALFWLATRLLEAPWTPTDNDLAVLDSVLADGRRFALTLSMTGRLVDALDAALMLDALSATPGSRLARGSALDGVLAIVDHFPASAGVLGNRQQNRVPFMITDEYDVQDLFQSLVLSIIPDIVPEDPAPKVAGRSSRLDFTSKATRLGFELKHVKSSNHVKVIRKEILLDERTYQEHPYIDTVVVFVHDPGCHIPLDARTAFESDLTTQVTVSGRTVRYVVKVR